MYRIWEGELSRLKLFIIVVSIFVVGSLIVIGFVGSRNDVQAVATVDARQTGLQKDVVPLVVETPDSVMNEVRPNVARPSSRVRLPVRTSWGVEVEPRAHLPFVVREKGATYYVSKKGNNGNGRSWSSAWGELDQINWNMIEPGDTILLDGGSTEMVYTTPLEIEKSGASDKPITIKLATEPGRDGRAIIFGGRSTPLPYCGQRDYVFETDGVRKIGVLINNHSWIVIDGSKWRGITIHGHNRDGIRLRREPSHITVRNVEIYDNGWAVPKNGAWSPSGEGVELRGTDITFERAIIHDNGQDAFQSGDDGRIANFTLKESWLYVGRKNPTRENESFNYCYHPDGIQIWSGGSQSGFLIQESIIGPGFMQGVLLGDRVASAGATVNDVTFRDVLFMKNLNINASGFLGTKPEGWVLDHVTMHCPDAFGGCLELDGSGHTVKDSILYDGWNYLPDDLDTYSGNCQGDTEGFRLGLITDPLFVDVNPHDPFSLDNYALSPDSPCAGKGSNITSVDQLLARPDN